MDVLNLATEEKQDEILSHFPIEGGTDWSEYTIYRSGSITLKDVLGNTYPTYKTLLQVDGSGMLPYVSVNDYNSSRIYLRITLDGNIIFNGRILGHTSLYTGIRILENSPSSLDLPYDSNTDITITSYVDLVAPLIFHNSMKIEVAWGNSFTNTTPKLAYKYMLK